MKKILILGSCGAGKSTFSKQLGEILNIQVYHLDSLFWKEGWTESSREEFMEKVNSILCEPSWIIDGNYGATLQHRLDQADTVIYLDFPRTFNLYRILKRYFQYRNKTRPDMAQGCKEKIDWEFIKYTWDFPDKKKPKILKQVYNTTNVKHVIIIKSTKELKQLLEKSVNLNQTKLLEVNRLKAKTIYLRLLKESDAHEYLQMLIRNRNDWELVEPKRPDSYYNLERQRESIRRGLMNANAGKSYHFGIFTLEEDTLIGDISLYEVKRMMFQSGQIGYSVDSGHSGKGVGTEAVKTLVDFAFNGLQLKRLSAGVSPTNKPSMKVLEKAGFQREGLMRESIEINGVWKDHYLYAILYHDERPSIE